MKWLVYTPTYEKYGYYYSGTAYEPPELGADTAEVEAETKQEAKYNGLRELRRTGSKWLRDWNSDGNPFKGLKAEAME